MPVGRPSKRTPDTRDAILAGLMHGRTLASLCDELKIDFSTVWRWEQDDEEFRNASLRAREVGTHHIADDCVRIADDVEIDPQNKRIMVDTRLRLIGKWNAKAYGEKVQADLTTNGKDIHSSDNETAAKLAAILEAAQKRRDQG